VSNVVLSLLSLHTVLSMDCQDLDYSFGYIEDASESDLSSVGYSQGINALTDETVDVTCTYVSY